MNSIKILVPHAEVSNWSTINIVDGISIIGADIDAHGKLLLAENGKSLHPTTHVGGMILALVSTDPNQNKFLQKMQTSLKAIGYSLEIPIIIAQHKNRIPQNIGEQLLPLLVAQSAPFAAYNANLASSLAASRRAYSEVQQRFAAVEDFVNANCGNNLLKLRCEIPVSKGSNDEALTLNFSTGTLSQIVPVPSTGICAFDIFVENSDARSSRSLLVKLFIGDSAESYANWTIYPTKKSGKKGSWISLALPYVLDNIPQTVRLELSIDDNNGSPLALGLSQAQAFEKYCISNAEDGKPAANNPLAIRVWESIRGIKTPISADMILPDNENAAKIRTYSASIMLQNAYPVLDVSWAEGWPPVEYVFDRNELSIHPPHDGKSTGAAIDGLFLKNAQLITVTVLVANEQSSDVSFAIVVGELSKEDIELILANRKKPRDTISWSGWHDVAANEERKISVLPPNPRAFEAAGGKEPKDALPVYIFTRMANGASNDSAWARVRDIVIECIVE